MMNNKAKKQVIITAILAVVLIFVGNNTISEIKKKRGANVAKPLSKVIASKGALLKASPGLVREDFAQAEKAKENLAKLEEEARSLKLKRDVFIQAPAVSAEEISPSDLTLYGIIWDKDNPIAIINEEILKSGDKIGTSTVAKIEENCVVLNDGTRDYKLNLNLE
jgi:hypothetical protein